MANPPIAERNSARLSSTNLNGTHQSPPPIAYHQSDQAWVGSFTLMASKCEIHIRTSDPGLAHERVTAAYLEAKRIEQHFSRYLPNNPLANINRSDGTTIVLDAEYIELMNYALTLYQASGGLFDISCGSLRHLWRFDGSQAHNTTIPSNEELQQALQRIGLQRIHWSPPELTLPKGMELDFGGIGKEYAVDRASQIIQTAFKGEYLVNFGGDCYCHGSAERPWTVAIESTSHKQDSDNAVTLIEGGVATSGTTKRFFTVGEKRYGHILNPLTGQPVENAPLSVTVVNQNCLAAGALSTLAMLQGAEAEAFLQSQQLLHWVLR